MKMLKLKDLIENPKNPRTNVMEFSDQGTALTAKDRFDVMVDSPVTFHYDSDFIDQSKTGWKVKGLPGKLFESQEDAQEAVNKLK